MGKVYYDPEHPVGIVSVPKLVKASKNKKRYVEEWLSGQNTYTLHIPVRKGFPRTLYTEPNIGDMWEMDIADLSSPSKYNDKYKYLLNVTDKTVTSITSAMKSLFQNRKLIATQSDYGTACVNATVQW